MDEDDIIEASDDDFDEEIDEDASLGDEKVEALAEDEMTLQDDGPMVITDVSETKLNMLQKPKVTIDFLTKYEKTRVLGLRIKQLEQGARPLVDDTGIQTEKEIAFKELAERKLPFIVRRYISRQPDKFEDWKLADLRLFP